VDVPNITIEDVRTAIKRTNNWKVAGADHIQNYWYKQLSAAHDTPKRNFNDIIQDPNKIPEFMTKGKTILIPKDENTEDPSKFRPITCLPTVYKIFTSVITQKIDQHIETHNIISEEQKGCRKNCKEQVILNQVRKKQHNVCIAYTDYQKAYDSVPHVWLTEILRIYKIHPQIIVVLTEATKKWRTTVTLHKPEREITTNEIRIEKPKAYSKGTRSVPCGSVVLLTRFRIYLMTPNTVIS
jgi:transposase-like protein